MATLSLTAAWLLASACGESNKSAPEGASGGGGQNPITAPVDYIGAVGRAQKTAEKTVDLATVQRAVQMFHAMEDRYPKDLQELVNQRYLPSLPVPPAGMRMHYNPASGQVRIVK